MFWSVVLEKTLEIPLDCKEIQPVHSEGEQSWVFFGRNDAEAETPILWPPDVKSGLIWKTLMLGKIESKRRRGWQDEMVGWHHPLNGHEFEQAPGVGDGQGGLACCSPWGRKESHTTEQLNWTESSHSVSCLRPVKPFCTTMFSVKYNNPISKCLDYLVPSPAVNIFCKYMQWWQRLSFQDESETVIWI